MGMEETKCSRWKYRHDICVNLFAWPMHRGCHRRCTSKLSTQYCDYCAAAFPFPLLVSASFSASTLRLLSADRIPGATNGTSIAAYMRYSKGTSLNSGRNVSSAVAAVVVFVSPRRIVSHVRTSRLCVSAKESSSFVNTFANASSAMSAAPTPTNDVAPASVHQLVPIHCNTRKARLTPP